MLKNKLALITGAASGIGLETSITFSNEGATVCMLDIEEDNLKKGINQLKANFENEPLNHSYYKCNVSLKENVETVFNKIFEKYNKIPTLIVNCAGILIMKSFIDLDENDFNNLINVNLKGTFLVSNVAAKKLIENYKNQDLEPLDTYASIINIASFSATHAMDYVSLYASSKSGIDSMTRSIARELGKYKIRCNSVLPGAILTPMVMKMRKNNDDKNLSLASLGRYGEPSEVAQVCLFLSSNMSSYVTGASIECSGGMHT